MLAQTHAAFTPAPTLRQAEGLVGLTYVPGRFTCMHLALLAQRELFGRDVAPQLAGRLPVRGEDQGRLLARWREVVASPVVDARTGDAVLFKDGGGEWEWHIGTLFVEGGEHWVLHTHQGIGASVLERLRDTPRRGLRVEGFYRWLAS